jgi:hypothetical protein
VKGLGDKNRFLTEKFSSGIELISLSGRGKRSSEGQTSEWRVCVGPEAKMCAIEQRVVALCRAELSSGAGAATQSKAESSAGKCVGSDVGIEKVCEGDDDGRIEIEKQLIASSIIKVKD